jgi:hypothetical protein
MVMPIVKRALLALFVLPLLASTARAGSYHVYACRLPGGESAPADGWSGSKTGTYTYAENNCARPGGALVAALGDQPARTANTDVATWAFATPPNVRLAAATLWRAGDADGGAAVNATYQFWLAGPGETEVFDQCAYVSSCMNGRGEPERPLGPENRVVVPGSHLGSHLYVRASCGGVAEYNCPEGKRDEHGFAAVVYLYAADLTLEQAAGPSAGGVDGELAGAASVSGTSDLTFAASDPGSGVYEAVFNVDGQVVQRTVLDENGGRCRNVGQTTDGLPAFLFVQPCLASVSADVGFDTTRLSNGAHHLVVSVVDAAGNTAPVLDRNVTVANPLAPVAPALTGGASGSLAGPGGFGPGGLAGPLNAAQPNGTNASPEATLTASWTATRLPRLTTGYGRAQTVTGQLTGPGGVPIAVARIDVVAVPAYTGAGAVAMPSPYTGQDGRFVFRIPGGVSSRTLRFEYRSHLGDASAVARHALTLRVDAGLALSVTPRTASVGRRIFFHGRLLGGSIPRGGKQLVLEARSLRGSWLEFNVVRADSRGRYTASYRFRFPGPARYQFRVLSEAESDYPFAPGASNVVSVRER